MSSLKRLVELGQELVAKRAELQAAEQRVTELRREVERLARDTLPSAMQELDLVSFRLQDGTEITLRTDFFAHISAENAPAAFEWLRERGFDGLLKDVVTVTFDRAEHDRAVAVSERLSNENCVVRLETKIHPQTLLAFIRERAEAGDLPPAHLFGIRPYSEARFTPPSTSARRAAAAS